jgi:site-specific recombinase
MIVGFTAVVYSGKTLVETTKGVKSSAEIAGAGIGVGLVSMMGLGASVFMALACLIVYFIAKRSGEESAKQELVSLRIEIDQLRQELDAANQALATANTPEQVQALTIQRQQLLDRIQADALMAQAQTETAASTTETDSPSSLARLRRFLSGAID